MKRHPQNRGENMRKLMIGNIVSLHGANFSNYLSIPPNLQNEKTPQNRGENLVIGNIVQYQ